MTNQTPYDAPESNVLDSNNMSYANTVFFSTSQRLGRLRWLVYGIAANFGLTFVIGIAAAILVPLFSAAYQSQNSFGMVGIVGGGMVVLVYVAIFAVSIILNRRRLHDLEQSGWLTLLIFVPLVNFFFGLYLLFAPGTQGENRYGLKPKPNSVGLWVIGLILPVFLIGIIAAIAIPAYQDYVNSAGIH